MNEPAASLPAQPSAARVCRTLKDGYWDRTEVIELADGSRRVRKQSKGAAAGPWGVSSLQREIRYLTTLPPRARAVFPEVLAAWDDGAVGYEMRYYEDHVDAGTLAQRAALGQDEVDALQDELAQALLTAVHEPVPAREPLSAHVVSVVQHALTGLAADPALAGLIAAEWIELNGAKVRGPRAAFAEIVQRGAPLAALDHGPCVRLHGDFFLENILWCARDVDTTGSRLLLVDPVSVAGVSCGPPVFDLVKYESYASGELCALRSAWVACSGFAPDRPDAPRAAFTYAIRWDEPGLAGFRTVDWRTRFRRAFEAAHGPVDQRLYRLIDGYFSMAMAVNTVGEQRRARLLKAVTEFAAVLAVD